MKAFLQNILPGWKHYLFATLVAILPNVSKFVDDFVVSNPGWTGGLMAGLLVFLKQITKPSA